MADQAVNILQLFARRLLAGQLAQARMAARAPLGQHLAIIIQDLADPLGAPGVGAKVIDHAQLAQRFGLLGIDQVGSSPAPLVMLAAEEGQRLLLMTFQAGTGALVVLKPIHVPVGFIRVM